MEFYDALGAQYDEMIDWESRYQREAPFFQSLFARNNVRRVIDAACGTGMHARWFAEWGLEVVAADPSSAMVSACRETTRGLRVVVLQAAFE
ncbi:MAG: class I SAM-dependent methyltransferase, partial [Armatimonadota bacterium]